MLVFLQGGHSPGIIVPVNSREGEGAHEKANGEGENEALINKPWQGRMVQFDTPPTTNCKHAHPKLEGEAKSSSGTQGDKGW